VITVEHEPVFTLGRRGSLDNVLVDEQRLEDAGISVATIERGGDITYHGPGQLVAYPILDLRSYGRDLKAYIGRLEESIARTLSAYGVVGESVEGRPGMWVGGKKIASIGVHVSRWVTMHGLALNVDVNPEHFAMIRPCGLDVEAISLAELVDGEVDVDEVRDRWFAEASELFGWNDGSEQMPREDPSGD